VEELCNIVTEEMSENDPAKIEFTILSSLVSDYSDKHFDLGKPTLQESIRERMFEKGISQSELAELLGTSQSRISGIVSGKVQPTFAMARKIRASLDIPAEVILGA